MNIEPDHVGGDVTLSEVARDVADSAFRKIAVATLVVSEGPNRREGHATGERCVALDHFSRLRSVDEVVIERSPIRTERQQTLRLMPDIKIATISVIKKYTESDALAHDDVEGHGNVNRIGAGVVAEGVAVPHRQAIAA